MSRNEPRIRFLTTGQLVRGHGPRHEGRRDRPPFRARVAAYLALVGTLTPAQVAYTMGVSRGVARRALDALCERGLARQREEGETYEATREGR